MHRFSLLSLLLLLDLGCKKDSSDPPTDKPPTTTSETTGGPTTPSAGDGRWFRATFSKDGSEIPFRLQLPASGKQATIRGGDGVLTPPLTTTDGEITIAFDIYNTRIQARREAGGGLKGTWTIASPTWGDATLAFAAAPSAADSPLFEPKDAKKVDAGAFKLAFAESGAAKLAFSHAGGDVVAWIEFTTGNIVHLVGNPSGGKLMLSGFDGSSPYLLTATIEGDRISGDWVAGHGMAWREAFTGTRESAFQVTTKVALDDVPKLDYAQIKAEAYKGKPLILELAGSWCPTCRRASGFLADLHNDTKGDELAMLTLIYELTDDKAYNKRKAEQFKREYKIPWEVRPIDGTMDDYWDILPSVLTDVNPAGFPIALFVAADGSVIDVHAGFPAEDAGPEYLRVTKKYRELASKLVKRK